MKKLLFLFTTILLLFSFVHAQHKQQNMKHSSHKGDMIHKSTIDNYQLAYHLIDMGAHAKHSNKPVTHHLMVYVKTPHGHFLKKGKIGFLIISSDGTKQKIMAMAMGDGFGADINLKNGNTPSGKPGK